MNHRRFDDEESAETALRLAGYQRVGALGVIWIKDGYRVKVVRDSWAANYFIKAA